MTKDVAPYTIVGGNPAAMIRPRFEPAVITALEKLAWWDRDIGWITAHIPALTRETPTAEKIEALM